MGRYVDYFGSETIPEAKKDTFAQEVLKLFREGGMMRLEDIQIYGRCISLLADPEYDDKGLCLVDFNSYEGDWWEQAGYNRKDDRLFSNKVGGSAFAKVVYAAYLLREFYALEPGAAVIDDRIVNSDETIGWINYVLGTSYSNQRFADPWNLYKICRSARENFDQDLILFQGSIPECCLSHHGVTVYNYVINKSELLKGLKELEEKNKGNQNGNIRLSMFLLSGEKFVRQYYDEPDGKTPAEKLEELKLALRKEGRTERFKDPNVPKTIQDILFNACLIPTECVLRDIADVFDVDFWDLLCEMEAEITPGGGFFEPPIPCSPETPISSHLYFYCSSDDRAYYLQPGDEHQLSAEMKDWLAELKSELDELSTEESLLSSSHDLLRRFVAVLADVNETYGQVYAYRDMFYKVLAQAGNSRIQAEVRLLERLNERYRSDKRQGRKWIRRYLSVLGNAGLKEKVLGA